MNPPFKGAVDKNDVSPTLPGDTTKSELLFVHLILRALDMGGRCAVIVPDGVLFGSSRAHLALRKKIIEENRLDGVVSMPSGVFKPYAGVSTAVLFFTRGAQTERIWFYDMDHDGFSLDDKRTPVTENDIPDVLLCWQKRQDAAFQQTRQQRLAALQEQAAPLKAERLKLHEEINRLTFEAALTPESSFARSPSPGGRGELSEAQIRLDALEAQIAPLQAEIDQLSRQFWVGREQVKANKYDLSASRYRQVEADEAYYDKPQVTLERLARLEQAMGEEIHNMTIMLEEK